MSAALHCTLLRCSDKIYIGGVESFGAPKTSASTTPSASRRIFLLLSSAGVYTSTCTLLCVYETEKYTFGAHMEGVLPESQRVYLEVLRCVLQATCLVTLVDQTGL